ncbi:MAG: insulinase family protein [Lachnospiraceae bacterium]|nr:insulinase family protein [Lachnospiraceae bacterium]
MDLKNLPQYERIEQHRIKELGCDGCLLRHKKSGARVFLIANDDNNKVFNIAFRTVPTDSTGVPHIIEHTVLCGSDKYPARDPFVELVKGSMNTFLNAMTYPDKTMYPVASTNDKDFFNLMSVYMDSVFHPNITKTDKIFQQEGWHYELTEPDGELTCNGVVFNEMKGAFSSADDVLERYTMNALYPDTTYAFVSGGDPDCIPTLTYEEYLAFYRRFYHPSNSYIYLYGDMDMEERLNWMDREYLSHYDPIDPDSDIVPQKPFEEMKDLTIPYSITEGEAEEAGNYYSWNKVVGTSLDHKLSFAFDILEAVLLNAPGAPLKKALQDKNIGEDIYGGFEDGIYHTSFNITVKDAQADEKELFVQTIEETLRKVADEGINKRSLLAAINSLEFRLKENDFGRWPRGLMLGLQCFDSWLYDENDPFSPLEYEENIQFLRDQMETGYFEELIRTKLLDNPFGVLMTAEPKVGMTEEMDKKRAEALQAYKETLSDEEIQAIIRGTEELREYQETPTPQEILEMIPMLEISDIGREPAPILNEERTAGDCPVVYHELFTSGISYMDVVFHADFLTIEEVPYLQLLKTFLGSVDTETYSYRELAEEINVYTGGVTTDFMLIQDVKGKEAPKLEYLVHMKALYPNLEKAMELALELILHSDFSDDKRLKEILGESRSRLKESLLSGGHQTAVRRSGSYTSEYAYLNDLTAGVGYYEFLDDLYRNFEEKKETMRAVLHRIITELFAKNRMLVSYTADEEGWKVLENCMDSFGKALKESSQEPVARSAALSVKNEGICCASQIQFVARTGNFVKAGLEYTGTMQVLKNILNYDYLWKNLREKGGAYGCMCGFGRQGDGYFVSYLDPHLRRTNQVYEELPDYVAGFEVSPRDMTKYIIGAISELDVPMMPKAKGFRSLSAYLSGITWEQLKKERLQILETTQEAIRALEPHMRAILAEGCLCAVGNEGKLKDGSELFGCLRQL